MNRMNRMMPNEQQQIDPRKAEAYLAKAMATLDEDPASLTRHERRLLTKYRTKKAEATRLTRDVDQIKNQIEQAQARLRSLELQLENELGQCNMCMEYLVDLKFVPEEPIPEKTKTPPSTPEGEMRSPNLPPQATTEEPEAAQPAA